MNHHMYTFHMYMSGKNYEKTPGYFYWFTRSFEDSKCWWKNVIMDSHSMVMMMINVSQPQLLPPHGVGQGKILAQVIHEQVGYARRLTE